MYARTTATPENGFPKPYRYSEDQPPDPQPSIGPSLPEFAYRADPRADPSTVTFVHGWNMKQNESINFSETMFKRLWHAGFKGHFAMFRWPTGIPKTPEVLDPELYDSFNFSEHRALVYGRSLAEYPATLSLQQVHSIPLPQYGIHRDDQCPEIGNDSSISALLPGGRLREHL